MCTIVNKIKSLRKAWKESWKKYINKYISNVTLCYHHFFIFFYSGVFHFFILVRCILFFRLGAVCRCLFVSGWKIKFDLVQIQSSMTLVSSTPHIKSHEYSGHFNIVKYVDLCNFSFYAINTDVVSLFADLSILFLAILTLYNINVLSQFESMNVVYLVKLSYFKLFSN
jgi:hypothetical protein